MLRFSDLPIELAEHVFSYIIDLLEPGDLATRVQLAGISKPIRGFLHRTAFRVVFMNHANWPVFACFADDERAATETFAFTRVLHIVESARYLRGWDILISRILGHVNTVCAPGAYYLRGQLNMVTFIANATYGMTPSAVLRSGPGIIRSHSASTNLRRLAFPIGASWGVHSMPTEWRERLLYQLSGLERVVLFIHTNSPDEGYNTASFGYDYLHEALTVAVETFLSMPQMQSVAVAFSTEDYAAEHRAVAISIVEAKRDNRLFIQDRENVSDYLSCALQDETWTSAKISTVSA